MPALVANQAESTSLYDIEGMTIVLQEGDGALFPTISNAFDYFYIRIGTDEANTVVKVVDRTGDTLTVVDLYDIFSAGAPIKLTVCKELLDDYQTYFYQASPINIGSGEYDEFSSINDFVTDFQNVFIKPGSVIDIDISDLSGEFSEGLDSANFKTPQQMSVNGVTTYIGIISVESSSGIAGDYSIILNVSSITNLAINQVVGISSQAVSGGTNPQHLFGAHKITNVDTENTRITINSKNKNVPSGAVTGTVAVFRTVLLKSTMSNESFETLTSVAIDANGDEYGLGIFCKTHLYNIAIINAVKGIYIGNTGVLNLDNVIISGCDVGIDNLGILEVFENTITACDIAITQSSGYSNIIDSCIHSCEAGLQITENSTNLISGTTITDTTGIAIHASRYAYVKATGLTLSGNGTDYSPALNTQGNKFGYIDDGT